MSSDYQLEDTLYLPFTTRAFATGIPTALVSGVVDIYEDVTATPIITAETLTVSLNSHAGFNMITVTATSASGFEAGKSYTAILDAGTVDSVSVIGEVVAHFTLDKSAAAKDLANGTDGLGAIKTETAAIVADTNELQSDDVPGLISTLDAVVDTVKVDTAAILIDTNELQGDDVPTLISTLDAVVDTVKVDTAAILIDTNELQSDDVPTLISTLDAVVDTVKVDTAAILIDTNELQGDDVPTLISTLDAVVDTVKVDTAAILIDTNELQTDDIPATLALITATADTITLPGQVVPPLTPTQSEAIGWLYKAFRNRTTQTATQWNLYDDDELVIDAKATVSDDTVTAIKQEIEAGP